MSPVILSALINNVALPELMAWLANLHAANKVVTEDEALAKLNADADEATKIGLAFLAAHPPTLPPAA